MNLNAISKLLVTASLCWLMLGTTAFAQTTYDVPTNSSFKSYMSYKAITDESSKQYKLQQQCTANELGLRVYNGYYTVAVGTGFHADIGDYIDVELSTGNVLHCIVGEMKQDKHTKADNIQCANGNVVEFIIDPSVLDSAVKSGGDISAFEGFEGDVTKVTVAESTDLETSNVSSQTENYLIIGKYATDLPTGETLFTIEYACGSDFNSIICSEDFYNEVEVGKSIVSLK